MATRTTPTPNPSPTQVGPARLAQDNAEPGQARVPWGGEFTEFVAALAKGRNDLEEPAIELQPVIANVLAVLRKLPGCRLSRMSGSGATCFALFDSTHSAQAAARTLHVGYPDWWVRATVLGGERIANSE